jgi:hypothetical protein
VQGDEPVLARTKDPNMQQDLERVLALELEQDLERVLALETKSRGSGTHLYL